MMISSISGVVENIQGYTIEVNTGVFGLWLSSPSAPIYMVNQKILLYTLLHWSTDNGPTLFGFETQQERLIFQLVTQCQGVGPKIGIALIAKLGVSGFVSAVTMRCAKTVAGVPGIGTKRAEQILLHAAAKIEKLLACGQLQYSDMNQNSLLTVSAALKSLSYGQSEIAAALRYVKENSQGEDVQILIKKALSFLASKGKAIG